MAHSKLIAGFIGPLLIALGAAMLINGDLFPAMVAQLGQSYGLVFLTGILMLLAGVAIVRVHNTWAGGWPVIVTVVGWLAVIGGLARMWFPEEAAPIAERFAGAPGALPIAGIVLAVLGAFLSYKAYAPDT